MWIKLNFIKTSFFVRIERLLEIKCDLKLTNCLLTDNLLLKFGSSNTKSLKESMEKWDKYTRLFHYSIMFLSSLASSNWPAGKICKREGTQE